MHSYFPRNCVTLPMRIVLLLMAGLAMLAGPCGTPSTASAAPDPEPSARFQVVVKEIAIHDDNEGPISGLAEMDFSIRVRRCERGMPIHTCRAEGDQIVGASEFFHATSDQKIQLNRLVPQRDDTLWPDQASYALGITAFTRYRYVVQLHLEDQDQDGIVNQNDQLGEVFFLAYEAERGLDVGTHAVRSVMEDRTTPGDYTVTFEIRRSPLPDLRVGSIKIHDLVGTSKKLVCMGVANHEPYDADAFEAVLTIDGAVPPGGRGSAGRLKGGASGDVCVEVALPSSGQVKLGATVDASHVVAEYNETNNTFEMPWSATPPKTSAPESSAPEPSAPEPSVGESSAPKTDLTVSTIKVNGRAPDGKDDCKAGKRTVTVTVKNGGKAEAGLFTTRLTVDGVDVAEQSAVGLEPGQEQEVRFEGVELKKGQHKLIALADANREVAEADEGNNALTVTARCA